MRFITPVNADEFVNIPWLYEKDIENGVSFGTIGAGGFILFRPLPNHRIEIMNSFHTDDYSKTFQWWNYNSETKKIVFYNDHFDPLLTCELPRITPDGAKIMHVMEDNPYGETRLRADIAEQVIDSPIIGGRKVAFLLNDKGWRLWRMGTDFKKFAKYDFNVCELRQETFDIDTLLAMQDYLMEHSGIEEIIYTTKSAYIEDEALLKSEAFDGNLKLDGFDFISATRAIFFEYLDTLIIQAYKRMYMDQPVDLQQLSEEILDKYFVDRFERLSD